MSSYFIHAFRMYRISDFGRVRGLAFFPCLDQDLDQQFEAFVEELAPYMMILDTHVPAVRSVDAVICPLDDHLGTKLRQKGVSLKIVLD